MSDPTLYIVTLRTSTLWSGRIGAATADSAIEAAREAWFTQCPHQFERIDGDRLDDVSARLAERKRYRVTYAVTREEVFEVDAFDSDDARDSAFEDGTYVDTEATTDVHATHVEDIGPVRDRDEIPPPAIETPAAVLDRIAQSELGLETLELRNSDRLDVHDLPVSGIKRALQRAFNEGRATAVPQQQGEQAHA